MTSGHVDLQLTSDEALVLFDVLHRWEGDRRAASDDPGEQAAFDALSCLLESQLVEPFTAAYVAAVHSARARLAGN